MLILRASIAAALAAAALPVLAASSAASTASTGASMSVGGTSTSIGTSSNSSSPGDRRVAEGLYRVTGIEVAAGRTGFVQLHLAPQTDGATAFVLVLPQATVDAARVGTGVLVQATHRAYGVAFARGDDQQAFFLVVDDAWQQDLQTRPVRG